MGTSLSDSPLLADIHAQPDALAHLLDAEAETVARLADAVRQKPVDYIVIAARGTSDNAATYAKYLFASFNRLPVALATPSLYTLYRTPPRLAHSLVVAISQSGESPDILAVVEEAKRQQVSSIAVTNEEDSPLARAADHVILQHAGEEKTIAATKTYITQLGALALLSATVAQDRVRLDELHAVPDAIGHTLSVAAEAERIGIRWRAATMCLVLGRGYNYATAFEIALKLKELSYVTAEPFSSADFMHGPIAIVQGGFPVIIVAPRGMVRDDLLAVAQQLGARGADLTVISDVPGPVVPQASTLLLPVSVSEWVSPFTAIVPGQLLAYYLTVAKGFDPDHPRGLTKVTRTV